MFMPGDRAVSIAHHLISSRGVRESTREPRDWFFRIRWASTSPKTSQIEELEDQLIQSIQLGHPLTAIRGCSRTVSIKLYHVTQLRFN